MTSREHEPPSEEDEVESDQRLSTHRLDAVSLPEIERGFETAQRRAAIAAALFNIPLEPVRIGRYTIVRTLGSGGMGVVYLADDAELDRRVAIKLLRGATAGGRARLQREAQTMARLQHPNVVTVYEVGSHDDQLFVAMEYVQGQTLRGWLEAETRSWTEILPLFLQAGEGLAAAHQAGIIHRDFKPDNVLVGDDGRVRVADFGLAYVLDTPTEPGDAAQSGSQLGSAPGRPLALEVSLTKSGAILGTPAYMAPEQFAGERTDARTDQFSFCVTLWEALYGQRPFVGGTIHALAAAVLEQRLREPPVESPVPSWLRAAMTRALVVAPDRRWPSMAVLLEVLRDDPDARRRRRMTYVGISLATLAVLAALAWLAITGLRENARRRYWNLLTEELLAVERERGLAQANDDASHARDATRMSVYRRYGLEPGTVDHYDPTVAAALLREVETSVRGSEAWISAANKTLGESLSHAVLTGHTGVVNHLYFSPDATTLYSAATDGQVWRWTVADGRGRSILAHRQGVTALALSPDGRRVVSGSGDHTVRSWSADTGAATLLTTHAQAITAVRFDPGGRRLLTASRDGELRLHTLDTPTVQTLAAGAGLICSVAFSPSGRRIAAGLDEGGISLWRLDDRGAEPSVVLAGHRGGVYHLGFVDDERLVSAADDGEVRLWTVRADGLVESQVIDAHDSAITSFDLHGGRVVSAGETGSLRVVRLDQPGSARVLREAGERIWTALFTPNGAAVVFACFDGTARLIDVDGGGGVERVFIGHPLALLRAAIDEGGRWLATGSYDGSVRLWDLTRPRLSIPLLGHGGGLLDADVDAGGERVVTAAADGSARVWGLDGRALATLVGGHGSLNAARFHPRANQVALATVGGAIELWDLDTQQQRVLSHDDGSIVQIAFDGPGDRLAAASFDTALVWSVASGELLAVMRGHDEPVTAIDFEPGGLRLATASADGTVRIWNAASGVEQVRLSGHEGPIRALVRSPDGRTLASASQDGTARLWPDDVATHAIVLAGHRQPVWDLDFDAAGSRVVTASTDGDARVWDAHDGSLLRVLGGHTEGVWAAGFADADRVITVSDDNTVRVWSLASGRVIVLSGHRGPVTNLALDLGGERFVSTSSDGTAIIWHLQQLDADADSLLQSLWQATHFCLSAEQRVRELGEDPVQAQLRHDDCARAQGR